MGFKRTNNHELREHYKLQNCKYYRVYRFGEWPKPKKHFYSERFAKRKQARNFCRNRTWINGGLFIVYPNGIIEEYVYGDYINNQG